mgnify:CR=1 FL=1
MKFIIVSNADTEKVGKMLEPTDMLSKRGFEIADLLQTSIPKSPDIIFTSPFISALQTVYPYCINNNKKVHIDYTLYPCLHKKVLKQNNLLKYHQYLNDIINNKYITSILSNNIPKKKKKNNIQNRLFPFLYKIINNLKNTEKTILFVTDCSMCNLILEYFNEKYKTNIKSLLKQKEKQYFKEGNIITVDIK